MKSIEQLDKIIQEKAPTLDKFEKAAILNLIAERDKESQEEMEKLMVEARECTRGRCPDDCPICSNLYPPHNQETKE